MWLRLSPLGAERALALAQNLLFGGVVPVGDGGEAFQAEPGEGGGGVRVRAHG